jgi:hypothetical protein
LIRSSELRRFTVDSIPLWRDISVVLLSVEVFVLSLIPLVVLYFANKGLWRLGSSLRPIFARARARVRQVETVTARVTEVIVAPIIAVYALAARLRRIVVTMGGLPGGGVRQ